MYLIKSISPTSNYYNLILTERKIKIYSPGNLANIPEIDDVYTTLYAGDITKFKELLDNPILREQIEKCGKEKRSLSISFKTRDHSKYLTFKNIVISRVCLLDQNQLRNTIKHIKALGEHKHDNRELLRCFGNRYTVDYICDQIITLTLKYLNSLPRYYNHRLDEFFITNYLSPCFPYI